MALNHILLALVTTFTVPTAAQDDHRSIGERADATMGFDQTLTTHHFMLFTDGGAIDVSVRNPRDAKNRDAIRSHLAHTAVMFGDGQFTAPMQVHDRKDVPGTRTMAERKATIRYRYVETPAGGRIDIVTTDPESLPAVHDFLRFQIADHRTGDSTDVKKR